jgi:hypothetical protein
MHPVIKFDLKELSYLGLASWPSYAVVRFEVDCASPQDLFCPPSLLLSEKEHGELVVEDPDRTVRFPSDSLCRQKHCKSRTKACSKSTSRGTCPCISSWAWPGLSRQMALARLSN